MGVTCHFQKDSVISKLIEMEERDKEEAKRLGIKEGES